MDDVVRRQMRVLRVSGPKDRYPWIVCDQAYNNFERKLDPAAVAAGLTPQAGDMVVCASRPMATGGEYWLGVEDLSGRALCSRGRAAWKPPAADMSTRELLFTLGKARACGGWYSPYDANGGPGYTVEELKAELAGREHVPNKPEGKALRRAAAQGKAPGRG